MYYARIGRLFVGKEWVVNLAATSAKFETKEEASEHAAAVKTLSLSKGDIEILWCAP